MLRQRILEKICHLINLIPNFAGIIVQYLKFQLQSYKVPLISDIKQKFVQILLSVVFSRCEVSCVPVFLSYFILSCEEWFSMSGTLQGTYTQIYLATRRCCKFWYGGRLFRLKPSRNALFSSGDGVFCRNGARLLLVLLLGLALMVDNPSPKFCCCCC